MSMNLERLVTEGRLAESLHIDEVSTEEMLRIINAEDAKVAPAVGREIAAIAEAIDRIAERMKAGGRLIYAGAGTSGRLGILDASECPPTFGVPLDLVQGVIAGGLEAVFRTFEGEEDNVEAGVDAIRSVATGKDTVIGIAASGRTPYTIAAVQEARKMGCLTVAISCNPGSPLGAAADIAIEPVVGPEVVMGSTRLKAGTAQKLVLNMISTGVMIRLGKVYSNLMVDMVASNAKLRERAKRIVMQATGADAAAAAAALAEAGERSKVAVVMLLAGVSAAKAEAALTLADGQVRAAVPAAKGV